MLTVTPEALNALKEHLRQHKMDSIVRITMMSGGCIGENLRFTLGKAEPNDLIFHFDDLTFLLDRDLSARCGAIKMDFEPEYDYCLCSGRNGGFNISSERFSHRCGWSGCWKTCSGDCAERALAVCC